MIQTSALVPLPSHFISLDLSADGFHALCAIAKLARFSKYLLQYFSIYYQMLTRALTCFNSAVVPFLSTPRELFFNESCSRKKNIFNCVRETLNNFISEARNNHVLIAWKLFKVAH